MSCDCQCSVALPHGAVGLSAVCVCGISLSNSLTVVLKTILSAVHVYIALSDVNVKV